MFILGNVSMWFSKSIRIFFFWMDRIIYNFIPMVYDLLISIARTSVLSQGDITAMADRIYKLLAVFMVFKVTFSLIMYVVNPDDFSEKTKGVGKLTANVIISLALLILTPYIFRMAYSLQTILLEDNSLATLIFGQGTNKNFLTTAGEDMAYITMSPFVTPNLGIIELSKCSELMVRYADGEYHANENCTGVDISDNEIRDNKENTMAALINDDNFDEETLRTYVAGLEHRSLALMFRQSIVTATNEENDVFIMDYKFIISTAVGVVILLLLITFCMDVALRSIKLAFLQLVAPIPIISYIDPKSGKDGIFKKWYQMCFKTFLSLFVRLLALYFAVYIISKVADMKLVDIIDGSYVTNALIAILIIIGALMFAKQLPNILKDLGIKLDGDGKFTLNPLKKFGEQALGGKQLLGLGAAGAAAGLAGATNFASRVFHPNSWKDNEGKFSFKNGMKNIAKSPLSAVGGAASAMKRGTVKALHGEKAGKVFANSYGEAMFAKLQREDLARKGSTWHGRMAADFNRITGNMNAAQRQELTIAQAEQRHNEIMNEINQRDEANKRRKDQLAKVKEQEKRVFQKRNTAYTAMQNTIDTYKTPGEVLVGGKRLKINVKDADQYIKDLQAKGDYYVKAGETFYDPILKKNRKATIDDEAAAAARGYKSQTGAAADKALDEQRDLAYKYLMDKLNKDADAQTFRKNAEDVISTGIAVAPDYKGIKGGAVESKKQIEKVDTDHRDESEAIETEAIAIADEKAAENDRYVKQVEEEHLDKNSPEYKAAAADNAARKVKSSQQEGWMPSADVRSSSYVRDPRLGGFGPGGPWGPPPGGGPGGTP